MRRREAVRVGDDEHVVNADAEEEEGEAGVHGAVEELRVRRGAADHRVEVGADAEGDRDGESNAGRAEGGQQHLAPHHIELAPLRLCAALDAARDAAGRKAAAEHEDAVANDEKVAAREKRNVRADRGAELVAQRARRKVHDVDVAVLLLHDLEPLLLERVGVGVGFAPLCNLAVVLEQVGDAQRAAADDRRTPGGIVHDVADYGRAIDDATGDGGVGGRVERREQICVRGRRLRHVVVPEVENRRDEALVVRAEADTNVGARVRRVPRHDLLCRFERINTKVHRAVRDDRWNLIVVPHDRLQARRSQHVSAVLREEDGARCAHRGRIVILHPRRVALRDGRLRDPELVRAVFFANKLRRGGEWRRRGGARGQRAPRGGRTESGHKLTTSPDDAAAASVTKITMVVSG